MSNVKLTTESKNWEVSAVRIYNTSNSLTLDVSGNNNLIVKTDSSNIAVFGPNTISGTTYNKSLNVNGPYFSNNVSAFLLPADSSNNRPAGQIGYIRYNTNENIIEYWSGTTNSWTPISEPSPTISNISPGYIAQDVSSTLYTITGGNFNAFSSVNFIGNVDLVQYPVSQSNFISNSTLTCLISDDIADASNNTLFAVKVTNTNSGFSNTSGNIVSYNKGPFWNTANNTNLGTGISNQSYVFATSPFSDLSASDPPPADLPIIYLATTTPPSASAPLVTLDPSGRLIGTMPAATTLTTYGFSSYAQDASGSRSPIISLFFSVSPPLLTYVSGTALPTPTYVDSGNNIVGGPVVGGFTIYSFTSTASSYVFRINGSIPSAVRYLIIAGGGGGGPGYQAGGGGAGGVLQDTSATLLVNTNYTLIVGAGGAGGNNGGTNPSAIKGSSGSNSSLIGGALSLTAIGGGGGASYNNGNGSGNGLAGGSGGGAGATNGTESGGLGTAGPPLQGYNGGGVSGYAPPYCGGGGGGAGGVGSAGGGSNLIGDGGIGITSSITGVSTNYAGGGGGGSYQAGSVTRVANRTAVNSGGAQPGTGGQYGGGYGAFGVAPITAATAGTANTGGGGGGGALAASQNDPGAAGGSGIVVIRFPSV